LIWNAFGFQYVFMLGIFIAIGTFFANLHVRVPR
jgi:hypothetical protein